MLAVLVFQVSMDRPARSSLQPMTQRVEASTVGDGLELMRTQSAFARRAVGLERMTSRRVCPVGIVCGGAAVAMFW